MTPVLRHIPCVLLLFGLGGAAGAQNSYFTARLTGAQEKPPVRSKATGWAIVTLAARSNKVTIFVESSGVKATAAHLHNGGPGANGPVIVPLSGGPRRWTGTATLSAAHATAVRTGKTYVNIHSLAHPAGEIRGQVVKGAITVYEGALSGSQTVPPNRSQATGEASIFLHEPDNVLLYIVESKGLQRVTAAHIHFGRQRTAGPVVFSLRGTNGQYCGVSPRLTQLQLKRLESGDYYVNIHTLRFPAGEIRTQVLLQREVVGKLSGANEVPPVTTSAIGEACMELESDGRLSYTVVTQGIVATAAHIHRAAKGRSGPVVFSLSGGPKVFSGKTAALTAAQMRDLAAGLYYVNVHSVRHPDGEIRDQLRSPARPSSYGDGCPGSNRLIPLSTAGGSFCIGQVAEFMFSQGLAKGVAVLMIGFNRDKFLALPLPFDLKPLGAPGCFLLTDVGLVPFLPKLTG